MNRFVPLLTFILIFALFYRGILSVSVVNEEEMEKSLNKAVHQDIVHCYAVEGFYPPSLSYLEENYGLTYDKDKFFIDYRPIAANILPDVTIIRLQTEKEKVNKYEITE